MLIFKALETNTTVNIINIANNLLSDKSASTIVNCLGINKTLKSVYLTNNKICNEKENIKVVARKDLKIFFQLNN